MQRKKTNKIEEAFEKIHINNMIQFISQKQFFLATFPFMGGMDK